MIRRLIEAGMKVIVVKSAIVLEHQERFILSTDVLDFGEEIPGFLPNDITQMKCVFYKADTVLTATSGISNGSVECETKDGELHFLPEKIVVPLVTNL